MELVQARQRAHFIARREVVQADAAISGQLLVVSVPVETTSSEKFICNM